MKNVLLIIFAIVLLVIGVQRQQDGSGILGSIIASIIDPGDLNETSDKIGPF